VDAWAGRAVWVVSRDALKIGQQVEGCGVERCGTNERMQKRERRCSGSMLDQHNKEPSGKVVVQMIVNAATKQSTGILVEHDQRQDGNVAPNEETNTPGRK
jgi:hypothetical protein